MRFRALWRTQKPRFFRNFGVDEILIQSSLHLIEISVMCLVPNKEQILYEDFRLNIEQYVVVFMAHQNLDSLEVLLSVGFRSTLLGDIICCATFENVSEK